jgi:exo-1,4-beta-D-glucosaminidase
VKSINWYWLSRKGDELNWGKSTWYMTPQSGYADYSGLQGLGKTTVNMAIAGHEVVVSHAAPRPHPKTTRGKTTHAKAKTIVTRGTVIEANDSTTHEITITNTGKTVAFQLHLRALKSRTGDDILPLIFSDNYLELAPGESRTIRVTWAAKDAEGATPWFLLAGWNLDTAGSKGPVNAGFTQ